MLANNGANHSFTPGMFLGSGIDLEPDGQPDNQALGDDVNLLYPGIAYPLGDEDGVKFTSLLVQGSMASVTVTASMQGQLDAWVDFNADGDWNDAGEQIFAGVVLSVGSSNLNFIVPIVAPALPIGPTYARFRFSSGGTAVPYGLANGGEVEDYKVWIEPQQIDPHKMHYPQYPDPDGWDVRAGNAPYDQKQKVLADDFLCTSNGLINQITFWGSWLNDEYESRHPFQGITNIHFSLHADIPDPDEEGPEYSKPGQLLWERDFDPFAPPPNWIVSAPVEEEPSWQGWYDPNLGEAITNNHQHYFRYEVEIPEDEAYYQTNGTIYWLDISVETLYGMWGWKTSRSPHFNDDAVWADQPVLDPAQWNELRDPIYSNSLDLAFIINEKQTEPETDWGDAPDQPYPTLAINNGANHTIVAGMFLGAGIDAEPDGQPNANATGDDLNINGLGGIAFPPGDEDGVTFTQLVPGLPATITVIASVAGNLDAWIDYNANGIWGDPGEQLLGGTIALGAGVNVINITVPAGTVPVLSTFARFRYSSSGGLSPTGAASDGEVEDYKVSIDDPIDWGDAPDPTYPTLSGSLGAAHLIGGPFLGLSVDPEFDGQPSALADGDDLDLQGDDEDGVTFLSPIIPGSVAQVGVVLGGVPSASLDAWIDFNADGIWGVGEQISSGTVLALGNNILFFPVPAGAMPSTNTFARFRVSSAGGLAPTGYAQDGEVEDYMVFIEDEQSIDWGDAPDSISTPYYPTLQAHNGAHHVILPGMFLGNQVDPEPDGQPTNSSDGDDLDILYPSLGDDEDGVVLTSLLMPGGYATVDVIASMAGTLDAWIDFGNDGSWAQAGDRIFAGQALAAGTNSLTFPVPLNAAQKNPAYSRFRFSSGGVASYTGLALDGEVEDHEYIIQTITGGGSDRGDAPDSYLTLNASGGPSHTIVPGVMLGAIVDSEPDGQPTAAANGDDTDALYVALGDDEDGVSFTSKIVAGTNASVSVVVGVSGGKLDAWVDFNADGDWLDAGEKIFAAQPVGAGINNLTFGVPQPTALGSSFARFRISSAGGLGVGGAASDGEVEDYAVELYQPVPVPDIEITNLFFKVSNTVAQVEWNAQTNTTYQVQSSTNLTTNVWVDVGGWLLGPVNWQTNSAAPAAQFYRVTAPWIP